MIYGDFHTHTVDSDGDNTIEEMADAAIELGYRALGITNHAPMPWEGYYEYKQEWLSGIIKHIEELRPKYEGKLELYAGVELDVNTDLDLTGLDFVIEANHHIKAPDGAYCPADGGILGLKPGYEDHFGGDVYALIERYFEEMSHAGDRGPVTIGHFDVINVDNEKDCHFDTTSKRFLDAALTAVEVLSKKDVIFEINTGALYRGYRTQPYPVLPVLRYMKQLGCRIILDSDSHSVEMLKGHKMKEALEYAALGGYRPEEIEKYPLLRNKK